MNDYQPHTLVLVRHSKASRDALSDRERPLTERGVRMAADLGRQLARRVGSPDLVVVSPAVRAQQTAQAMDGALRTRLARTEETIYTEGPGGWLTVLQALPESAATVVVVGHEPTVSSLAYALHADAQAPGLDAGSAPQADAGQARGDGLARQIAFGVSTATAVVLTVPGPWTQLAPGTARLADVLVAER